jgi:hypothetical protein
VGEEVAASAVGDGSRAVSVGLGRSVPGAVTVGLGGDDVAAGAHPASAKPRRINAGRMNTLEKMRILFFMAQFSKLYLTYFESQTVRHIGKFPDFYDPAGANDRQPGSIRRPTNSQRR